MQPSQISLGSNNQKHLDAYLQYCQLVGDNGGKMMSQRQYEEYKKNYPKMLANRLYTTWYNSQGTACKVIGPSTKCFCDHFYKNHDFLEAKNGKLKCKTAGCKCINYDYIPVYGSQDFKCGCKHSNQVHDTVKRNCKSCPCKVFQSTWVCQCGEKFSTHQTVSENKEAKEAKSQSVHPVNGGIVSYSSMLDGVDRFQNDIKQEIKKKGIKVQIQEFVIPKKPQLCQDVSALELVNKPLSWLK